MFSGITSYLFGSTSETTEDSVQQDGVKTEESGSPVHKAGGVKAVAAEEDEWMLVNKSSSRPGTPAFGPEMEQPFRDCTNQHHCVVFNNTCVHDNNSKNNSMNSSQTDSETKLNVDDLSDRASDSDTILSDISSLPERVVHPSMDESWLVTPPPCFTAGGNSPLRLVATNPLENLLIEHPSMSVYGSRGRPSSTGHHSDISESSNDVDMVETNNVAGTSKKGKVLKTRAVTALPPRRPRAVAARVGLLAQVQNVRSMQRSIKKKDARKLSRKSMDRSNKVQHQQSSCKQPRRKHYMLRPSGANNDRKTHS